MSLIDGLAAVVAPLASLKGAVAGPAGLPIAFVVGVLSFFTPCVLPLVPGYLSYVSGLSGEELEGGVARGRVLAGTALFVLGFAMIFTALGATASVFGSFLGEHLASLNQIAGIFVIVMGVIFLSGMAMRPMSRWASSEQPSLRRAAARGAVKVVGVFMRERGVHGQTRVGVAGALPLGAAFAVGWIPCVGPSLSAILALASREGSATRGAALLFAFSLGFGVWFLVGGLAFRRAARAFGVIRRHMQALTLAGGVLLITIGVLLLTNQWARLLAPLRRLFVRWAPPI